MKLKNVLHANSQRLPRTPRGARMAKVSPGGFRVKLKLGITVFLLLLSFSAFSQQDSLMNYLELAAKNSPAVRQKFYEYQAALQKVPQAGALQDPELSLGVFLKPMELVEGRQVSDITLMQMFPWFGVLRNAKDEMSLMANAKFEEFRDSKLQVYYDVQRTWYDLFKLRENIQISEKNVGILKSIENLALIRYKTAPSGSTASGPQPVRPSAGSSAAQSGASGRMSGMPGSAGSSTVQSNPQSSMQSGGSMGGPGTGTSLADLYRITIEISDLENSIALLHDQERSVIAGFNSLLNRPSLSPVYSADTLVTDTLKLSLPAVADSIRKSNPMLGMIEYERKSYEARQKMVKAMGYPMVGLGLNYSVISKSEASMSPDMNGKDMLMPMVRMILPIYRKRYRAMQKEAELMSRSSNENFAATSNNLQTQYYQAVQQYEDARRRITLYDEQYQLASKSLELVVKSYSASGSDLTDVLRVRQQTLDYELSKIQAAADLNTATALIKRLMASSEIE